MSPVKSLGAWISIALTLSVALTASTFLQAHAEPVNQIPLEIVPICSNAVEGISTWKVTNKNAKTVDIQWNNIKNNKTGAFTAPAGESKDEPGISNFKTFYEPTDPNNTTAFTYQGETTQTNAQVAPCDNTPPPVVECIDGYNQENLDVDFLTNNTVSIAVPEGKKLCEDINLYLSSYIMPRSYNREDFFGNSTAYPQQIFNSLPITIKKDTTGVGVYSVTMPVCENTQVDLYYAPEITTVGINGHGTQNILSTVTLRDEVSCLTGNGGGAPVTPPVLTPTNPTAPTQPGTPNTPVMAGGSAQQPIAYELPRTGPSGSVPYAGIGILLSAVVYGLTYALQPKRRLL